MSVKISRKAYAKKYGPTKGDRIRLADTELIIEVEHDYTDYGEESIFGGGKSIRDGQDQCPLEEPMSPPHCDLVITNAVIVDYWGIVKGDIGIREGRIIAVGKSGNPLTQCGVDPRLVIGPGTDIIAGEGRIVVAGGIDTHIHFICPQQIETAIASGITTLIGGGTGSSTGTWATTCTPGAWNIMRMLQAFEALPVNVGILTACCWLRALFINSTRDQVNKIQQIVATTNDDTPADAPIDQAMINKAVGVDKNASQFQGLGLEPIDADTLRTTQQAIAAHGQAVLMRQAEALDSSDDDEVREVPCKRKRQNKKQKTGAEFSGHK